jgi:G3E family GTPase
LIEIIDDNLSAVGFRCFALSCIPGNQQQNTVCMNLILVGGFLGSGKTTAVVNASLQLMQKNIRVGVITNDQGDQLVDREYVDSFRIPSAAVLNGCFCCNYNQLDTVLTTLRENDQAEFVFAESVGSCTDLIATVAKPLSQAYHTIKLVISIFADASLLVALIEDRASFLDDSVRYIYKKQLEEADFLILNKADQITPKQLGVVDKVLKSEYPDKIILHQNSLNDQDISRWLYCMEQFTQFPKRQSLSIDYPLYGEGESKLAWLDKAITVTTQHADCTFVVRKILGAIFNQIQSRQLTIGHLKFFLEADQWKQKISFTTTSTAVSLILPEHKTNRINILINARVQSEPLMLQKLIDEVLAQAQQSYSCDISNGKWASFKPGYPRPTHRVD